MATAAVRKPRGNTKPVQTQPTSNELDPSIQSIIDKGRRNNPEYAAARATWALPTATSLLLWACFTPLDLGPLAFIALVPLCLLIRLKERTKKMYRSLYLFGFIWSAITLQWMRLGHPSMYVALAALSAYIAFYFPAFVALSRVGFHRFRVPLVLCVPIVWTGLEFIRAHLMTGFSWYYLGHSQWRWVEFIQISDLFGAYGVSFVVAMANAGLAMALPKSWLGRLKLVPSAGTSIASARRPIVGAVVAVAVLCGAVTYGFARRSHADFKQGPRVALVQGNFVSEVNRDPKIANKIIQTYDALTRAAMLHGLNTDNPPPKPEMIIWPESMFPWPMFEVAEGMTDEELLRLRPSRSRMRNEDWIGMFRENDGIERIKSDARAYNASLLIGMSSVTATPDAREERNSVAYITPLGYEGRYDKMHLVMFGEYVPFKKQLPVLSRLTPYSASFGLEAGTDAKIFDHGGLKFAPVICFEDTVPHLVHGLVRSAKNAGTPVDFLVNNTNDGWFHGSSELDQHLITAAFRCVETRTPMVRAVNTGISAFIDGDGVVREPDIFIDGEEKKRGFLAENGRWNKAMDAAVIDNIPLDDRTSLYVRTGDVFAGSCGILCLALMCGGFVSRTRKED